MDWNPTFAPCKAGVVAQQILSSKCACLIVWWILRSESPSSDVWESLLGDIEHVVYRIDMYSRRFDGMVLVLTSFIQIVESRPSFQETKSITRLTYLALIFVPLGFVSDLFSMSGD